MIGAKLKNEDLVVIELLANEGEEDMLIDPDKGTHNIDGVTLMASHRAAGHRGGNAAEGGQQKKQPLRPILVKDVMGRLVVPSSCPFESTCFPSIRGWWKVVIVLVYGGVL
jgi:hypothetical protein